MRVETESQACFPAVPNSDSINYNSFREPWKLDDIGVMVSPGSPCLAEHSAASESSKTSPSWGAISLHLVCTRDTEVAVLRGTGEDA